MLIEIRCDKFREKTIEFHSGLNVVLGDSVATNSIGKSTLLMVLDFVYGGESFLDHNKDVVDELGDHDYFFTFQFGKESVYFRRGTHTPDLVYKCDDKYSEVEPISIEEYTTFLKASYSLGDIELSFRSIVSLFSRVWGKENLDVKHPLHSFKSQKPSDCVTNTIKLFKKYEPIKILSENVKNKNDEKSTISKAAKTGLISKTTKTKYKENITRVNAIDSEIEEIKNNLKKYAVNISEIANREVMELKVEKDRLLEEKLRLDSRLLRVRNDLNQNKAIKSKHLEPLIKYFPGVNTSKLEEVESFHSNITKILRKELKSSEAELVSLLSSLSGEIDLIDTKISSFLAELDNPNIVIDRVYELSQDHSVASKEIEYFEMDTQIKSDLKEAKELLAAEKIRILELIENILNDKNRRNVTEIYSEERRSPTLNLGQNSYTFELVEDTGTGKAYSNLILLDLAFLEVTALPFLAHDSVLFKNIQNDAVAKLIDLYESTGKQTFIAIDEIEKYGDVAEKKLKGKGVIQLDNNNVLYIKDWRK
tara:strand:+ start:2550 stop:4157 length:1608 start_codon:yes stop_codon:yes gene_type:complete